MQTIDAYLSPELRRPVPTYRPGWYVLGREYVLGQEVGGWLIGLGPYPTRELAAAKASGSMLAGKVILALPEPSETPAN